MSVFSNLLAIQRQGHAQKVKPVDRLNCQVIRLTLLDLI
jgi:hypothetical protein